MAKTREEWLQDALLRLFACAFNRLQACAVGTWPQGDDSGKARQQGYGGGTQAQETCSGQDTINQMTPSAMRSD